MSTAQTKPKCESKYTLNGNGRTLCCDQDASHGGPHGAPAGFIYFRWATVSQDRPKLVVLKGGA